VILSNGLNVCTVRVLMRYCHLNKSLVRLQREKGRHVRIVYHHAKSGDTHVVNVVCITKLRK
jgi:hypothetical protein